MADICIKIIWNYLKKKLIFLKLTLIRVVGERVNEKNIWLLNGKYPNKSVCIWFNNILFDTPDFFEVLFNYIE